jgi:hypothetical protein
MAVKINWDSSAHDHRNETIQYVFLCVEQGHMAYEDGKFKYQIWIPNDAFG